VDLRVAGLETDEAVRALPQNDSEQAEQEQRARAPGAPVADDHDEDGQPHIDVKA
jgi:hypothetical protein